jgi:hypothetical protein
MDSSWLFPNRDYAVAPYGDCNVDRFIAELIGVSPIDDVGNRRQFGIRVHDYESGIMWVVYVSGNYTLHSNMHVTRVFNSSSYVVHPLPTAQSWLSEQDAVTRPDIWITNSCELHMMERNSCYISTDDVYVSIARWLPGTDV